MVAPRKNYLNNKDLMKEIQKSKISYSEFLGKEYEEYDTIIDSLNDISSDLINETLKLKADLLTKEQKLHNKKLGILDPVTPVDPLQFKPTDLVFRVMTDEHIPEDDEKTAKSKTKSSIKTKTNFPPFKHFIIDSYDDDGNSNFKNLTFKEVGRSHWQGGFENGYFCLDKGKITMTLAKMLMMLVSRNAMKGNWRGYTYNDEMQGQALLQLSQVALQFNEAKSSNPFSYYTETINHSFTRILNTEKKNQKIRDDILIANGANPSFTRQLEHEIESRRDELVDFDDLSYKRKK